MSCSPRRTRAAANAFLTFAEFQEASKTWRMTLAMQAHYIIANAAGASSREFLTERLLNLAAMANAAGLDLAEIAREVMEARKP